MFRAAVKKSPFLKCFEKLKVTNPKFQKLMISENLTKNPWSNRSLISKALLILVDRYGCTNNGAQKKFFT